MDDVTLTDDTQRFGTTALEGPSAAAIVTELTGVDLNSLVDLERQDARVGTIPCSIIRRSPGKFCGRRISGGTPQLEALWQTLQEKSKAAGGGPIGYSALSAIRLEQGVPGSVTISGKGKSLTKPLSKISHISYTKGCYTARRCRACALSRKSTAAALACVSPGKRFPPQAKP